jgi:hypothetical protein
MIIVCCDYRRETIIAQEWKLSQLPGGRGPGIMVN